LPRVVAAGYRIAERIAESVALTYPRINRDDLRKEARAAFALWLVEGPRRSDNSPRFARWQMQDAALRLWQRVRADRPAPVTLRRFIILKVTTYARRLLRAGKLVPVSRAQVFQSVAA
jgi:hypothetical protein